MKIKGYQTSEFWFTLVSFIISGLFVACHNSFSRKLLEFIPEAIIGPLFNKLHFTIGRYK